MNKLLKEFLYYILQEDADPMLPWQDKSDRQRRTKASSLARYPDGHPGKEAWRAWKGSTPTPKDGEKTKDKKTQPDGTTPSTSSRQLPNVPQSAEVPISNAAGTRPPRALPRNAAATEQSRIDSIKAELESGKIKATEEEHSERIRVFTDLWQAFISAPTEEEQVAAVQAMVDLGLIESSDSGAKIYLSPNCTAPGLDYKAVTGGSGTGVTKLINQIARDTGIEIPPRQGSRKAAMAARVGPASEAAITALLAPNSEENVSKAQETRAKYEAVGGDTEELDRLATGAQQGIQGTLPDGATVTGGRQIGGLSRTQLKQQYDIDSRDDPTDVVIDYEYKDPETGQVKTERRKVSLKVTGSPDKITMKNAGMRDAGQHYLGDPSIDADYEELKRANNWAEEGISEQERDTRARKFKEEYTKRYASRMEQLAADEDPNSEGQKTLLRMWEKVHGCGKGVYTAVVNRNTGKTEVKDPDHYCKPRMPFKVKRSGTKVAIEMSTGPEGDGKDTTEAVIEIRVKTESSGDTKLMFEHVTRRPKKPKPAGEPKKRSVKKKQ